MKMADFYASVVTSCTIDLGYTIELARETGGKEGCVLVYICGTEQEPDKYKVVSDNVFIINGLAYSRITIPYWADTELDYNNGEFIIEGVASVPNALIVSFDAADVAHGVYDPNVLMYVYKLTPEELVKGLSESRHLCRKPN